MPYPAWLTNAARKILLPELTELHELADERWNELQKTKSENTDRYQLLLESEVTKHNEVAAMFKNKEDEFDSLSYSYRIQSEDLARLAKERIILLREVELLLEERTDHILQIRNLKQELKDAQAQLDRTAPMATPAAKPRKPRKAKVNNGAN